MKLAITGGTGFVGGHLLDLAPEAGHAVRALARQPQGPRAYINWVAGALDKPESLARLCKDADAVIHVAGVVNGTDAAFRAGNVDGTAALIRAAKAAGARRFVFVSSLAAREPGLSAYGRSKAEAEALVRAEAPGWTIVRPPAIYGPRDRELLELFRLARRRIVPLPPRGRLSVIAAEDLCRLLLALAGDDDSIGRCLEPDDGRPDGWSAPDFARAIGAAVGTKVLPLPLPHWLLLGIARADRALRGDRAKLTRDRVDYFCHPDWVAAPAAKPSASLWAPGIDTATGLAATAHWYRAKGWLR